jgi:hypothetical protein
VPLASETDGLNPRRVHVPENDLGSPKVTVSERKRNSRKCLFIGLAWMLEQDKFSVEYILELAASQKAWDLCSLRDAARMTIASN